MCKIISIRLGVRKEKQAGEGNAALTIFTKILNLGVYTDVII